MTTALQVVFWVCVALLVYAEIGYPLVLVALASVRRARAPRWATVEPVDVSLIVAAHAEATVIADRVRNARALDWPPERLEVIVACDGSPDDTAALARAAGADLVLELPHEGKHRAQDAAVRRARGALLAFSDANVAWEPSALRALTAPFTDPQVGYACGQVRFVNDGGTNQEGLYWRYEMALRSLESRLASVTAGNGAIYATRRETYIAFDPVMGHDLSLPFNMVKRGLRAVYEPAARATERMVPTNEGEFARKTRMMRQTWPVLLHGGLLSPRGYGPTYLLMIASHRLLRYASPFLHLLALIANAALLGDGVVYVVTFAAQIALIAAAFAGRVVRLRVLLIARYYVLMQAAIIGGLFAHLRRGHDPRWAPAEGTR